MADTAELDLSALLQNMAAQAESSRRTAAAQDDAAGLRIGTIRSAYRDGKLSDVLTTQLADAQISVKELYGDSDGASRDSGPSGGNGSHGTGSDNPQPEGSVHPQDPQASTGAQGGP